MRASPRAPPAEEPPLPPARPAAALPAVLARGGALLGLWLLLAGPDPLGLVFGLPAVALASWASLRLLPPAPGRLRPGALLRLLSLVLRDSAAAGWDVAGRAVARPLRLAPGVITVPLAIPPGPGRDGFRLLASLAPGALPLEDRAGSALRLHALDTGLPLADGVSATAAAFRAASREPARDG